MEGVECRDVTMIMVWRGRDRGAIGANNKCGGIQLIKFPCVLINSQADGRGSGQIPPPREYPTRMFSAGVLGTRST